jgi:hypothetical protein
MRYVESKRAASAEVGVRAKAKVRHVLDPAVIGASVRARLEELGLLGQTVGAKPSAAGRE